MYDLFVLGCLIVIMLFIVYNFYIDYIDWSNTGNTFAEGMASQQIIININSKKPTWEEFKDKMSAQSDIKYYPNNFRPQNSRLIIPITSPLSKMVQVEKAPWKRDSWKRLYKGKGGVFQYGEYVYLYRRTYELPDFPWKKYGLVIHKPSWDIFKRDMLKKEGVTTTHDGKTLQISDKSSYSKILPKRYGGPNWRVNWKKLFVTPSTWAIPQGYVYLYPKTYMLSGFDWTKWPVAPASTWSSGGSCPIGCKKPICVSGNCKTVSILGNSYKSCSGTCSSLNLDDKPNVCKFDNQCTPELCGEEYFPMDDETPCSQKQWSNEAWDKKMGEDKTLDPIDVNRSICPGIGGPYGCGPIGEKEEERTIFTEREMKMVLANRDLIPTGINIRVENQGSFIRIGKNLMNDVSHIRNVAIPNISDKDYETLGRVIAKLKTDTGAQNEVTTLKLTNSINNILTGKPISNSQVDWGYEIPKSNQTTGMFGDNSNALMSGRVVKKSGYQLFAERRRSAVITELTNRQRNGATPNQKSILQAIEAKWSSLTDEEKGVWKKKAIEDAKFRGDIKNMSEKPDGGLCMWKGCERLGKAPYDSIWNLY